MADWPQRRLGDLCDVVGRGIAPKYDDNGEVIVINQRCIRDGRVDLAQARRHGGRAVPEAKRLLEGDVMVNSTGVGTLGRTAAYVQRDSTCVTVDSHVAILRPRNCEPGFLRLLLRHLEPRIEDLAEGSTGQTELNRHRLADLEVVAPPLDEQRAIAGVLGALDDKIDSNRRLVRTLEELGRAELAIALAGPDGEPWECAWPEIQLGDALSLIETGDRPKGGVGEIANGVPSVGAESIVAPGVFDFSKTKFVPEEYFARMRRGVLQSGDVLLYKDGGTPGNFIPKVSMCQDGFPFEVAALNSHVYRLRVGAPYSQAFLYFWLSSQRLLDEMWLRGTGAAIPSLNSTNVKGLPFPVIPPVRLAPVLPVVDELMSHLHKAAKEQRTLGQLRDALLPELLSGRLRVPDAEEMVASA